MIQSPSFAFTVLAFLLVIGPLIFIHELGHYFVGRWFGVKADVFSIGFGRELFGWTDKRGTRWKVGWMPLGGYVKFKGDMNPASQADPEWLALPPEERAQTFQAKPVWQRFLIVFAGPAVNFLFAILVFIAFFSVYGQPRTPAAIGPLQAGSPAAAAGFRAGDRVLSVDGDPVSRFEDMAIRIAMHPGQPMHFVVDRAGAQVQLVATPAADVRRDQFGNEARVGRLGVPWPQREVVPLSPIEAVPAALDQTVRTVDLMVTGLWQIISGQRSVKEMGGPLKIAQFSGQQASLGWVEFILFMTAISINLGFINLLPIPLLDGGHLLFYLIEGVRRRPLPPQAQEWAFRTGLAALLALMIFVTLNDLASFGVWSRLGDLIG